MSSHPPGPIAPQLAVGEAFVDVLVAGLCATTTFETGC